ncbi:MAG: hypothetical protein A3A97_00225 [Candidatus Terrybacteria bacterium RIFCSPLOWO2_01_FULL_40_23]|uniref:Uncharacterized protein n=1 Tax=Candidatus Terrybacteria bacterium RIFCSPLOWO2_01_FULL_40_23 TaxID=1802366 RepID=A0A1G2PU26_9BACT|nr:MAG: hypothetical protein A3A97_00225 [Candidatus Terrybacteria bacterium RIFCSPLOWO2_01_FULL_40_23]
MKGQGVELPPHLLKTDLIRNMKISEERFTTPWAMMVDEDMRCYLNGTYLISESSGGTVTMRIERRSDGYHVFIPDGEKYLPSTIPWVGAKEGDLIPVKEVHSNRIGVLISKI